ncbi:hypothetical protein [Rhizobium arsenicireducens]
MTMKLSSNFAILDVEAGRTQLEKHFATRPPTGPCPEALRIPITITGYIDYPWGRNDGTSQEFAIVVESLTT